MKGLYTAICVIALASLTACIENYDVAMEDTDNEVLVVEGDIVGGQLCEFILQRSSCKTLNLSEPRLIAGALVYVICSNGEVYGVEMGDDCHYYVKMGELDPNETYHLQIKMVKEGVYESEPMRPLPVPSLSKLSYTMANDGETVQLRISNDDPQGEMYYLWTYDEHWEINTPLVTDWYYDRYDNSIKRVTERTNRGWCKRISHPIILGSNLDYGNGGIHDYVIYTLSNLDNRFNTRYHTKVRQMAISREQYEYYKQMEAQSTQTGGIFTLMPSQLPSNIHNNSGFKAEGYVGVHLNTSDAEIYINRADVGYKPTRLPEIIPDSIVAKETWLGALYDKGYRIYHYNLTLGQSEWTRPWCIDCRDPYWGASLERPDFWQDK